VRTVEKDFKKLLKEKIPEKWLKKENLVVLVLTGVLLFIIALPTEDGKTSDGSGSLQEGLSGTQTGGQETNTQQSAQSDTENDKTDDIGAENSDMAAYADALEERLEEILSQMEAVGQVKVMITLRSSEELVVEKEEPVSRSATNEIDSQGGSRIVNQVETGQTTVYKTDGTASEPYVIKTLTPEIEGVVVVAEGAGTGTVDKTVTEIVQALFGLEANKVKVVRMEQKTSREE
jgi:stage III sporulation protein AG